MAKANILTGARAKLIINGKAIGLFASCNWSIRQGKDPAFILGRYNPAEITPTSQEAISMDMRGFRVVDAGPYAVASATHLKDLLNEQDFSVAIVDRQTGKTIFTAEGCRITGWSSGVAAKGVSDISLSVIGIVGHDESIQDDDDTTASKMTDGI